MRRALILLTAAGVVAGCSDGSGAGLPPRTYLMGFSILPPRFDSTTDYVITAIDNWVPHADAAIMHVSPPWAALLGGVVPDSAVRIVELPLAQYYRSKGLDIVFTVDATDGLNRAAEAPELVAAGRSIADTMVQRLYREWTYAVAWRIQPAYLGLAAETNLIRALAPDSVYQAIVAMTNAAATQINAASLPSQLFVSIQVEVAWGRPSGTYQGIAQDLTDFPFVDAVGLSSYPYLGGFADPEALPLDYYSRIVQGTTLPVLVVEGGWPSISVGGIMSSRAEQSRYIGRQAQLVDSAKARGLFQLSFYDFDLSAIPAPPPTLSVFAHLGLADSAMNAKPALASWDSTFRRPYAP